MHTAVTSSGPRPSSGSARRAASKVEFMLTPLDEAQPADSGLGNGETRHSWKPGFMPATSSLLVRSSLTPDGTLSTLSGGPTVVPGSDSVHEGEQPSQLSDRPLRGAFGSSAAGSLANNSRRVTATRADGSNVGFASAPSATVPPPATGSAVTVPFSVVHTFPLSPADGEEGEGQLPYQHNAPNQSRAPHDGRVTAKLGIAAGGAPDSAATHEPLCIATGKRPSFVDGSAATIANGDVLNAADTMIGAEREDVFVDEFTNDYEDIPPYQEDDDGTAWQPRDEVIGTEKAKAEEKSSGSRVAPGAGTAKSQGKASTSSKKADGKAAARRPSSSSTRTGSVSGKRLSTANGGGRADRAPSAAALRPHSGSARRQSSSHAVEAPEAAATGITRSASRSATPARTGSSSGGRTRSPGSGGARANTVRNGRQSVAGANARRHSNPLSVTEQALKSINHAAFTGSSLKPKAKRAKMLSEFLAAHQRGATEITAEWQEENDTLYSQLVADSFAPHRHELLRLVNYVHELRKECREKLEFASSTCNYTLDGVEELLIQLHDAGLTLTESTNVLSGLDQQRDETIATTDGSQGSTAALPPPAWKQPSAPFEERDADGNLLARGRVMAEVRDADAAWREAEPHAKSRLIPASEMQKAAAIKSFFTGALQQLRAEAVQLSLPPAVGEISPEDAAHLLRRRQEDEARNAQRAAEALMLKAKLAELTDAVVGLMKRVQEQDAKQRSQINGLQRALDEMATRQKLADDVLNGCLAHESESAAFSFSYVKELEMQLRTRMDAIEAEMRSALAELVEESTNMCVDSGFCGKAGATQKYSKENGLRVFASRMERSGVEQASMLRDAQEVMQRLWQSAVPYMPGREEKRTLLHHSLPEAYEDELKQCDKDTLIRLIHHLSLQSPEATRCLMSALHEHQKYLLSNPAEAVAIKEQEDRRAAVAKLLEKLYEERSLHDRPHQSMAADGSLHLLTSSGAAEEVHDGNESSSPQPAGGRERAPLSEVIANMARRYNEMMQFEETYARALARQREELEMELNPTWRPSFFDREVPIPQPAANSHGGGAHRLPTVGRSGAVVPGALNGNPQQQPLQQQYGATANGFARPPSLSSATGASPAPVGGISVAHTVAFLQKANPSMLARVEAAATGSVAATSTVVSVVGDGRWGGRAPARPSAFKGTYSDGTPFVVTGAARDYSSLTASSSTAPLGAQQPSSNPPAPGIPTRKKLVSHVMTSYNHTVDQLSSGAAAAVPPSATAAELSATPADLLPATAATVPVPPPRAKRVFDNHDLPFLQKQRQVLEPLVGKLTPRGSADDEEAVRAFKQRLSATV